MSCTPAGIISKAHHDARPVESAESMRPPCDPARGVRPPQRGVSAARRAGALWVAAPRARDHTSGIGAGEYVAGSRTLALDDNRVCRKS